jgi:hypothetical protein
VGRHEREGGGSRLAGLGRERRCRWMGRERVVGRREDGIELPRNRDFCI